MVKIRLGRLYTWFIMDKQYGAIWMFQCVFLGNSKASTIRHHENPLPAGPPMKLKHFDGSESYPNPLVSRKLVNYQFGAKYPFKFTCKCYNAC